MSKCNCDEMRSYDDWAEDDLRVRRGQKSTCRDADGTPLFHRSQVVYRASPESNDIEITPYSLYYERLNKKAVHRPYSYYDSYRFTDSSDLD